MTVGVAHKTQRVVPVPSISSRCNRPDPAHRRIPLEDFAKETRKLDYFLVAPIHSELLQASSVRFSHSTSLKGTKTWFEGETPIEVGVSRVEIHKDFIRIWDEAHNCASAAEVFG